MEPHEVEPTWRWIWDIGADERQAYRHLENQVVEMSEQAVEAIVEVDDSSTVIVWPVPLHHGHGHCSGGWYSAFRCASLVIAGVVEHGPDEEAEANA